MRVALISWLACLLLVGCGDSGPDEDSSTSVSSRARGNSAPRGARQHAAAADTREPTSAESDSKGKRGTVPSASEPKVTVPDGPPPKRLVVRNLIEGTGKVAGPGDIVTLEYIGVDYRHTEFTNSWQRPEPFAYELGSHSLFANPGWERGIPGMKVGGRRELIIPPRVLGYAPGTSPLHTAVYVIDLVAVE